MRHIAFVIPTLDRIGGAERQMMLLAKGLSHRSWQIGVVALAGTEGEAAKELEDAGVAFTSLQMRKGLVDPRGWFRMNRWLKREQPDIVHAHLPHAAWLARWSRVTSPSRILIDTIHSSATGSVGQRMGYRISSGLPDRVTAVSSSAATRWLSAGMVSRDRLVIVPNGIDLNLWKPDEAVRSRMRDEVDIPGGFLWIAVGRLEYVKNYPALLHALAKLPQTVHLVIAGTGSLTVELRQLTGRLRLSHRVRFLGFEPNVMQWMQAADAFVLPSRWEGLPTVLLEAGACELPSVGANVPGIPEIIEDAHTGLLATPCNVDALASTMNRLMQMPGDERAAMGRRARVSLIHRFDLDTVLGRWEQLYNELFAKNPRPRRFA